MKWPWSTSMSPAKQQKKELLEQVRTERGTMAKNVVNLERANFHLDELVRRSIAELHNKGSTQ